MRRLKILIAFLGLAAVLLPAASVQAAPVDDLRAVFADWRPDGDVTSCRFTKAQLLNARDLAASSGDFDTYAPGFRDEVGREITRHDSGGCRGIAPISNKRRDRSPLRSLRITAIKPKGGSRESVTIRNTGSRTVSLKGATLRDRSGRRLRLVTGGKLRGRRSLRVVTGCAPGRRKAKRIGSRLFACRKGRLWDDRGDVVKIVDSRGTVVAQRGYGTLRRVARF